MHDFIFEFHNTKIYFILLIVYEIKWNLLFSNLIGVGLREWRWERDCGDAELMGEELCVYSVTC
jgi:hypothetical protein